jgi:RNA polymerase sigma-70 factor (ECF subfamily)
MVIRMAANSNDTLLLLARARAGDRDALNEVFTLYRERLRRMIEIRMDWRLQARIDASDVIQDAFLDVAARLEDYLRDPKLPLFLWLRLVVGEQLMNLHRHHLGAQMRDPRREVSLYQGALPEASSVALAAQLLGRHTSPTQAAVRAERMLRMQEAINRLDPIDREVIALRNFEQLTRAESAQVLGIEEAAAAKRYIRALKRLKAALATMPGGLEGLL